MALNAVKRPLHHISYEKEHFRPIPSPACSNCIQERWEGPVLKLVVGAVVSIAMVGSAIAADLPRREPVPPPAPVAVGKAPIGKLPWGKGPVVARY